MPLLLLLLLSSLLADGVLLPKRPPGRVRPKRLRGRLRSNKLFAVVVVVDAAVVAEDDAEAVVPVSIISSSLSGELRLEFTGCESALEMIDPSLMLSLRLLLLLALDSGNDAVDEAAGDDVVSSFRFL